MDQRTLIAAVGPLGGTTKLLFSDASLKKSSAEPLDVVADELRRLGMQPESVDALVARTERATAKRRERATQAVERMRRLPGMTDDLALDILNGDAIPFIGTTGSTLLVKARHAVREPGGSFQKAEPETNIGGLTFRHSGAVHDTIRRLARGGKKAPVNDDSKQPDGQYGSDEVQNPGHGG